MSGREGNTKASVLHGALALLAPWRALLTLVALLVLAAALLELVPPLLLKRVVDEHLAAGSPTGLLPLALAYLAATAAGELVGFGYAYLTAIAAQGRSAGYA